MTKREDREGGVPHFVAFALRALRPFRAFVVQMPFVFQAHVRNRAFVLVCNTSGAVFQFIRGIFIGETLVSAPGSTTLHDSNLLLRQAI